MSFGQDEAIREFKELTSIASTTTLSISTTSNSDSLLHSALVQLNPTNRSSFAQIKSIIANVHPSFNFDGETTLTQELFLKSLTIRMNSLILEKLFDQVSELQKENDFWSKIENSSLNTSLFLVQSESYTNTIIEKFN